MRKNGYFLPATLIAAGFAALCVVAVINGMYASRYGTDLFTRAVSIGGATIIDLAAMLLAAVVGVGIATRRIGTTIFGGLMCAAFLLISMGGAAGYMGLSRMAPAEAARINAQLKIEAANAVRDKLSQQADYFQGQVSRTKRGERQTYIDESRASILSMLAVPTISAEEAMPDPMSAIASRLTGLKDADVQALFIVVMTAALVLAKVVLVGIGSYLWPRPTARVRESDSNGVNVRDSYSPPVPIMNIQPVEIATEVSESHDTEEDDADDLPVPSRRRARVSETYSDEAFSRDTVAEYVGHREALDLDNEVHGKSAHQEYVSYCEENGLPSRDYNYFRLRLEDLGAIKVRRPDHGNRAFYVLPYSNREAPDLATAA